MKDINNILVEAINNIKSNVIPASKKDKFLSKTSLRRE